MIEDHRDTDVPVLKVTHPLKHTLSYQSMALESQPNCKRSFRMEWDAQLLSKPKHHQGLYFDCLFPNDEQWFWQFHPSLRLKSKNPIHSLHPEMWVRTKIQRQPIRFKEP